MTYGKPTFPFTQMVTVLIIDVCNLLQNTSAQQCGFGLCQFRLCSRGRVVSQHLVTTATFCRWLLQALQLCVVHTRILLSIMNVSNQFSQVKLLFNQYNESNNKSLINEVSSIQYCLLCYLAKIFCRQWSLLYEECLRKLLSIISLGLFPKVVP